MTLLLHHLTSISFHQSFSFCSGDHYGNALAPKCYWQLNRHNG